MHAKNSKIKSFVPAITLGILTLRYKTKNAKHKHVANIKNKALSTY